jgi:hypothetical protein
VSFLSSISTPSYGYCMSCIEAVFSKHELSDGC